MTGFHDPIRAICRRDFYPAFRSSGHRRLEQIFWIVWHDEEALTAESAARFFQSPRAGGSAHLCVDEHVCYRCLANSAIPWGASSAPLLSANRHGFHIEQAGRASWSRAEWLAHRETIERAAYKTAVHARKFDIPIRFVDAAMLVRGAHSGNVAKGITTHAAISAASRLLDPRNARDYTHIDPGAGYPLQTALLSARGYARELEAAGL